LAEALMDGCHALTTSAALYGLRGGDSLSRLSAENRPEGFRARLRDLLRRPRPAVLRPDPALVWPVALGALPALVKQTVGARRAGTGRPGSSSAAGSA